jgi:hypothetical protein
MEKETVEMDYTEKSRRHRRCRPADQQAGGRVMTSKRKSWRDVLPVHPAAEMFPLMSEAELLELGKDIKKHGLQSPIIMWAADDSGTEAKVLDGRNRLDAMEAVGLKVVDQKDGCIRWNHNVVRFWDVWPGKRTFEGKEELQRCPSINDPYEYVISANIHRRHLTAEQKRDLIDKLLKADPTKSDRAIAKIVKADDKTVAKRRRKLEGRADIPNVKTRTDTKGRKQPAKKKIAKRSPDGLKKPLPDCPNCAGTGTTPITIFSACGLKISETQHGPCPCRLREERRGNPTLYDDLKRLRDKAVAGEKRGEGTCDAPSAAAAEPEVIAPTATTAKSRKVEPERKPEPVVQQRHCSFCHKSEKEVRALIGSCSADICRDCIESFHVPNPEPTTADQIAYDERRRMEIGQLASRLIDRDPEIAREVEKVLSDEVFGLREAAFRLALAINHRFQDIKFGVDDDAADDDDSPDMPKPLTPQDVAA